MKSNERKNEWIDISLTLRQGMARWPGDTPVGVRRVKGINKTNEYNISRLSMSSHSGTHVDAPLHFISGAKGLDRMPLSAGIGPARVLGVGVRQYISENDLVKFRIKRGERILFKTRNSYCHALDVFKKDFVYLTSGAAQYLAKIGVVAVGIDYLSISGYDDKNSAKTHRILLESGICVIEGLGLAGVRPGRYDLICLPLKIINSDGAPARVVIRPRG
jgi:arylformamidase